MERQIKSTFDKAEDLFLRVKDELCKPEEDVVPYSVCQSAYYSIVNYLGSFLIENGIEFQESENVADLLNSCREIDNKFNDLHLAPLYNPTQRRDVWMNIDTANDYLTMVESTRQMLHSK
ncbi:MAG: hypothetical protein ACI9FN_001990 [Saprospiraceae bacterium]|jgi:hypothetical protein